jgi:pimeloyl-ACP methyl ester carboxylesterase
MAIFILTSGALLLLRMATREWLRTQAAITTPSGIDETIRLELGGLKQSILLRGEDRSKPVLLWLHGGPGYPSMPFAHRFDGELVKHFVVVHWDQRGAGQSFDPALSTAQLTPELYVADAHELVLYLRERFQQPKIYLVGHSWGSVLGSLVAARYPELLYAYVSVAHTPSTAQMIANTYTHALTQAHEAGDTQAAQALEALGPPPYTMEQYVTFATASAPYVSGMRNQPASFPFWDVLCSPAYSLGDSYAFFQGATLSQQAMYPQLLRIDLFMQATRFDLPIYIFEGRYDSGAFAGLVENHYAQITAPDKQLVWFEDSSHFPMYEEPAAFNQALLQVLAQTQATAGR